MDTNDFQGISAQIAAIGKRVVPVYPGGKTQPYANGQSYPYELRPELYRDAIGIAMVLDDHILIDYDGNKPGANAVALNRLEAAIGQLPMPFQLNGPGTSIHFIFKVPADLAEADLLQSCDGRWHSGVDIKRGNQLVHIKTVGSDGTPKYQNFAALQNPPDAPPVIIEALRRKLVVKEHAPIKEFDGNANPAAVAAFDQEVCDFADMAEGQNGGRNNRLNELALTWLSVAYSGDLDPEFVDTELRNAAAINGCEGVDATIASAKRKACTQPRLYSPHLNTAAAFRPGGTPDGWFNPPSATAPQYIDSSTGVKLRHGEAIMGAHAQLDHFTGCVYVFALHRVLIPNGDLLKPEQFNVRFGGHSFVLTKDGKTTRKAFEAFTESQVLEFHRADSACFRPELPPGHIVTEGGRRLVNTYVPAFGNSVPGDVSPFLDHVARLLTVGADSEIILSYLAACVQMPGTKFQWCPVIQGVEGNGKTLLYRALDYALGERYTHLPNAADITNPFNGWLEGKLLIGVEEMKTAGRKDVADALKPMITNSRIEIQSKGQDQRTGDNRANFLIFSNHKDAVLKTENDRRYSVFYTAQQEPRDLQRDRMTGDYFARLYGWLENGGYAHVAHYLATRPITVDVLGRAPHTSSTAEALRSSLGIAEQLLQEAIELEEAGFRGDFICTAAAADYLANRGKRLGPQRLADALASVGYIRHPGLESSSGKVRINGKRLRLYVKRNSLAASLTTHQAVATAWERANDTNPFTSPTGPTVAQPFGPAGGQ